MGCSKCRRHTIWLQWSQRESRRQCDSSIRRIAAGTEVAEETVEGRPEHTGCEDQERPCGRAQLHGEILVSTHGTRASAKKILKINI